MRGEFLDGLDRLQDRLVLFRRQAEADGRHGPGLGADLQPDRQDPAAAGDRGGFAFEREGHRLLGHLARLDLVGPGLGERAHIGLEGRVVPVPVILGLEGVAFHAAGDLHPWQHLMGEGAKILERAGGVDQLGKGRAFRRAVDPEHLHRTAGDAVDRMEHDEACAVGAKIGDRPPLAFEDQGAVGLAFDPGAVMQLLGRILADGIETDFEGVGRLPDFQVLQNRVVGAPVLVAHHEGNVADRLLAADLDVAKRTIVEFDGQRTGAKSLGAGHRLVGAEKGDRAVRGGDHGGSP